MTGLTTRYSRECFLLADGVSPEAPSVVTQNVTIYHNVVKCSCTEKNGFRRTDHMKKKTAKKDDGLNTSIRFESIHQRERFEKAAKEDGRTLSGWIRHICEQHIKDQQ